MQPQDRERKGSPVIPESPRRRAGVRIEHAPHHTRCRQVLLFPGLVVQIQQVITHAVLVENIAAEIPLCDAAIFLHNMAVDLASNPVEVLDIPGQLIRLLDANVQNRILVPKVGSDSIFNEGVREACEVRGLAKHGGSTKDEKGRPHDSRQVPALQIKVDCTQFIVHLRLSMGDSRTYNLFILTRRSLARSPTNHQQLSCIIVPLADLPRQTSSSRFGCGEKISCHA